MNRTEGDWYWGEIKTGASLYALNNEQLKPPPTQPIGFKGANPGKSLDDRGLPRIRVKAVTRRIETG